ncbi:protein disulfide oxidoreductase [Candidatus Thiosymbion oneisti]|uniref:protein disulfide oxidoreductase n=1 Tax=Candidatus Thiosymbion oneisti TaxID=589554 RepID=UPI000B7EF52A|nr:protein disulfide oxidoreductase [Candidatus Thiosymbion oneisti]
MKKAANSKPRSHRWLGQLVLILAIFMVLHWWRSEPLASGDAPALTGDLAGGGRFDLDGLQGKPVLVHFWATWCPVCRFGDDTIAAIAEDFNVITVAIQSGGAAEIMGHLSRASLSFPVIPDSDGVLATAWGVSGVPASFVLDGSGRIRFATVGYTTGIGLRGRLWVAGMLD